MDRVSCILSIRQQNTNAAVSKVMETVRLATRHLCSTGSSSSPRLQFLKVPAQVLRQSELFHRHAYGPVPIRRVCSTRDPVDSWKTEIHEDDISDTGRYEEGLSVKVNAEHRKALRRHYLEQLADGLVFRTPDGKDPLYRGFIGTAAAAAMKQGVPKCG